MSRQRKTKVSKARARTERDWPDDSLVDTVRDIRAILWKRGGGTTKGYLELVEKLTEDLRVVPASRTRKRRSA